MNIVDKKEIKVGDIVVNNVGNTFEVIEGFKLKDMDMVIDPKEELPLYDVVGNINDTPYLLKKKLTDVHNVLQNTLDKPFHGRPDNAYLVISNSNYSISFYCDGVSYVDTIFCSLQPRITNKDINVTKSFRNPLVCGNANINDVKNGVYKTGWVNFVDNLGDIAFGLTINSRRLTIYTKDGCKRYTILKLENDVNLISELKRFCFYADFLKKLDL